MITKERIKKGIQNGIILIVDGDLDHGTIGTVCQIDNNQFYFGGQEAEDSTAEEYLENVPLDDIVNEIYETLEDFRTTDSFEDEYHYYDIYLD